MNPNNRSVLVRLPLKPIVMVAFRSTPFFRATAVSKIVPILNHVPASQFGPATLPNTAAPVRSGGDST
jgi:hypothetical protein